MNYRLLAFFVFLIFVSCSKFDSQDELNTNSNAFPFYDNLSEVNNFPKMVILTNNQEIFDEPKINAELKVIEESIELDYKIAIETRGSSSQMFPKKSYGFETRSLDWSDDIDVNLGGFPEEEDWILYGPYSDKSLIRNKLTFDLSNSIGYSASQTKFYNLFINNENKGLYVLMEKIKRDKNRVAISSLDPNSNFGDNLTGGYILKFDWAETGDNNGGFFSLIDGMRYNYHYPKPDEISSEQESYIQSYINSYENIMNSNKYNSEQGYSKFIDIGSFVDFIILQEISRNVDAYGLSTYIYKDKESINNMLTAGPIWDFNHGFGNCDYYKAWETDGWNISYTYEDMDQRAFWWLKLWNDDNFKEMVKDRYKVLRRSILSTTNINTKVDQYVSELGNSVNKNFTKWPILGEYIWPNKEVFDTYQEEIIYLKSWINNRLTWMDSELN